VTGRRAKPPEKSGGFLASGVDPSEVSWLDRAVKTNTFIEGERYNVKATGSGVSDGEFLGKCRNTLMFRTQTGRVVNVPVLSVTEWAPVPVFR
jgi:hypothetical protein